MKKKKNATEELIPGSIFFVYNSYYSGIFEYKDTDYLDTDFIVNDIFKDSKNLLFIELKLLWSTLGGSTVKRRSPFYIFTVLDMNYSFMKVAISQHCLYNICGELFKSPQD